MAGLRVFLIGVTREDLATLRARVTSEASFTIVGEALGRDVDEKRVSLPAGVDVVLMSQEAALRADAEKEAPQTGPTTAARGLIEELTPRERDVLALLADGYGNRAIAERLGLSEHTVKFHLTSIFGKLGVSTRTAAVRRGLDLGIIDI